LRFGRFFKTRLHPVEIVRKDDLGDIGLRIGTSGVATNQNNGIVPDLSLKRRVVTRTVAS
jgi:hypothetical protein